MKNKIPKLLILLLLSSASNELLASTDVDAAGDLQQQLQTIQTMNQTDTSAASTVNLPPPQATTTSTTTTTTAQSVPSQADSVSVSTATTPVSLPKERIQLGSVDIRDQAFAKVTNSVLPLSPAQIEMLRNLYDATQRAAAVSPGVPPRPTSTSLAVNLSPGATPPIVRLGAGFVTSMVFVDSTGAPWPIDSYSLGNPQAFNIQWDKKSNILLVQAITAHRVGNLAVILRGLNTPVMIDLTPGQAALDVRVDLRIPGLGPQAKATYMGLPGTENPILLSLLDGIPPNGATSLRASDCEDCAWLVNGKLYLRTQFTVLSPGWTATLSSADGTHVYEMEPTPLVLASYNGKTIKLRIEGY